ncbi:MAG: adenylate/guanylate cyclase domain-containing protein [Deltaproteobacteria bacterium]|jgi:adenylate cyclase|nr:adenylate/guanylate cyclase domain-containing protein [Deltaproteobacteria bacterium]
MKRFRINSEKARSGTAVALTGLCVAAAMILAYIGQPFALARLDLAIHDLLLPLRAAPEPSKIPIIIDLDEASIAQYGQWPWPRHLMAKLTDSLADAGVAAIAFDIMFAEADRTSLERIRESLRRDLGLEVEYSGVPRDFLDYDQVFAHALQRSPAVLAAYALYAGEGETPPLAAGVIEREKPKAVPWRKLMRDGKSATLPLPVLREAAPIGFVNAGPDMDGILREIPLVVRIGESIHPSLALRALMLGLGIRNLTLETGPYGLEAVRLGKHCSIQVSPEGMLRIPFIGPRKTYPYYSAAEVLAGRVPAEALQGRIAFVGTSLAGLKDIWPTPVDPAYPGVEAHAAAVDVMLAGNAIVVPFWTPAAQLGIILLTGLISTLAFGFAKARVYLPVTAALMGGIVLPARHLFSHGLFLSPLYGVLTVAALGAFLLLVRFWREERQKRILRGIFSRYVSPEVVSRVTRTAGDLMAGEERELSVMFSDIRGFASLSETLKPQEVVTLLNRYFAPMTTLVREHSGTLDKFIGDALMAYWNAPLDVPEHPIKAVETALCMQEALPLLNERLRSDMNLEIRIGVGVHTGGAFVGNMGTADFVNYTLIGDNVNLTSRLEGLCPQYGVGIVVSGEVKDACGESFVFQRLDTIRVKGKTRPVAIHLPLRREEAEMRREELAAWEEARESYAAGDFTAAERRLDALCDSFPEAKLYSVFADRVRRLRKNPPEHWNGIWSGTHG